jgi:hypothetical protein
MQFIMGTRWDLVPAPHPLKFFARSCALCKAATYTEKEFPEETTVVCNVCSSLIHQQAENDPDTVVVWDLPPDLLGNLLSQAQEKGVSPENFIIGFLEWKTGHELQSIRLYNREDKQVYIVNKR